MRLLLKEHFIRGAQKHLHYLSNLLNFCIIVAHRCLASARCPTNQTSASYGDVVKNNKKPRSKKVVTALVCHYHSQKLFCVRGI